MKPWSQDAVRGMETGRMGPTPLLPHGMGPGSCPQGRLQGLSMGPTTHCIPGTRAISTPNPALFRGSGECFGDCPHAHVAPLVLPAWHRTGSAVAAAKPWLGASGSLQPAAGLGQRDGSPAVPGEGGIELTGGVLRGAEPSLGSEPASAAIWGQEGGKGWGNPSSWLCFPCWVPAMGLAGGVLVCGVLFSPWADPRAQEELSAVMPALLVLSPALPLPGVPSTPAPACPRQGLRISACRGRQGKPPPGGKTGSAPGLSTGRARRGPSSRARGKATGTRGPPRSRRCPLPQHASSERAPCPDTTAAGKPRLARTSPSLLAGSPDMPGELFIFMMKEDTHTLRYEKPLHISGTSQR